MKTLFIIRHAKSSWAHPGMDDFDRPLNERGEHDAKLIGRKLKKRNISPDIMYSSPAKRARQTCNKICKEISYLADNVIYDQDIYDNHMNSIDFYLGFIMQIKNTSPEVFLVGHNNVWSELVAYLLGKDMGSLPTCAVVQISFDIDSWEDIGYGNGKLEDFLYPKMGN